MTCNKEKKNHATETDQELTGVKTGRKGHYNNDYNYCIEEGHVTYIALT